MFRTLDVVAASTRRRESGKSSRDVHVGDFARYDGGRALRTGAPEVILREGKDPEHLLALLTGLHERGYGAIVSRVTSQQRRALERSSSGLPLVFLAGGRVVRLGGPILGPSYAGTVAILTAGTADVPVAEEARAVLESVGVTVATGYDVGVAGIHRLMKILRKLARQRPRIFLVFAGREGALPTVVTGLVAGPVIGIPTSGRLRAWCEGRRGAHRDAPVLCPDRHRQHRWRCPRSPSRTSASVEPSFAHPASKGKIPFPEHSQGLGLAI